MKGAQLKAIRKALNLSASAWGRALGYSGSKSQIAVQVRRFERDDRRIPFWIARLALMYARHGIPGDGDIGGSRQGFSWWPMLQPDFRPGLALNVGALRLGSAR